MIAGIVIAALAAALATGGAGAAQPARGQGAAVFEAKCAMCHSVRLADGDLAGPNLAAVAGRAIGAKPGFTYSAALANARARWTPAALDLFLKNPAADRPGTTMPFTGLKKDEDRTALIEFLVNITKERP